MPISDALKSFRKGEYGDKEQPESGGDEPSSPRVIHLTDDEKKAFEGSSVSPGQEVVCEVSGKLEGDHLHVMSVRASGGGQDVNADAEAVMSKMRGPITPMQVQPSPS